MSDDAGPIAPFVVAIDGPAASGKGTLARRIAERFGLAHLDTGKLYRAVAFRVLEAGGDPANADNAITAAQGLDLTVLGDPRLTSEPVARASSVVAAVPAVRETLLRAQREFAAHPPAPDHRGARASGAVLDGRDIGTAICPDATVKIFLTGSLAARAERRVKELRARGATAIYDDVLQDMTERDARDSQRRVAPLAAAPDAVIIDTTGLDADQVFDETSEIIARALRTRGP